MGPRRAPTAVPSTSSKGPSSAKKPQSAPSSAPTRALRTTYDAVTAKENRSVVQAVGMFGVAVAFLASSWSEYLVPGF